MIFVLLNCIGLQALKTDLSNEHNPKSTWGQYFREIRQSISNRIQVPNVDSSTKITLDNESYLTSHVSSSTAKTEFKEMQNYATELHEIMINLEATSANLNKRSRGS